ncbi:uncharacterized protein TA19025 [Theileria annulata]|uniref:Uncharacterized protein n=1 Tax=Theileria annulata TaxID=5874 RepID=Q4UG85_THEAN|nr:uncharacterized protein TA19025 [Theileria annulata]CAI73904.1 hypothetical protein TA19025 [Theileria annulata]|eukprot:XP_954581.1 hypothetical protein TA19025 [Theileria annulata]
MEKHKYLLYLILFKCVFVYTKNRKIYNFAPILSQLNSLKVPKNTLFMHTKNKNSMKNSSRSKNLTFHEEPPEDVYEENSYDSDYDEKNSQKDNKFINETNDNEHETYNQGDDERDNHKDDTFSDEFNPNNSGIDNVKDHTQTNTSFTNDEYNSEGIQDHPSKEDDNKKIVDDIEKEEQMKSMNFDTGNMMDSAKQAKENADKLLNEYKVGTYNTETNKHTLPKDDAGNIIITNTTTTPVTKQEEEKVDPLKSIRDATISLYERAKQKNLPVPDPGDLSTPEKIYTSLNALEYIIDGYRYTKIDVNDSTNQPDLSNENDQPTESKESEQLADESETDSMEPERFLQLKNPSEEDNENDDEPDYEQNDDNEDEGNFNKTESDDEMNESENESYEPESDKTPKTGTLSAHEAVENLKAVLNQLSSVLEKVVEDNIGVRNVITKQMITSE